MDKDLHDLDTAIIAKEAVRKALSNTNFFEFGDDIGVRDSRLYDHLAFITGATVKYRPIYEDGKITAIAKSFHRKGFDIKDYEEVQE